MPDRAARSAVAGNDVATTVCAMKRAAAAMMSSPAGRGVIITGGSSGIGLALTTALLQKPEYTVFVTGTRPLALTELAPVVEKFSATDRIRYSQGDTGDELIVKNQCNEAIQYFGDREVPFSGLCINAGIGGGRYALEDFDVERFDKMFQTNVRGVFLWLKQALPTLKSTASVSSQIVVTSSVMGSRPVAMAGPYCASKYAVNGLVLSLRAELKASGHTHVKCGLVCPAGVATPWWEDKARGFTAPDAPPPDTSKFLKPEAVANACMAMLEQDSSSNAESVMLDATG